MGVRILKASLTSTDLTNRRDKQGKKEAGGIVGSGAHEVTCVLCL